MCVSFTCLWLRRQGIQSLLITGPFIGVSIVTNTPPIDQWGPASSGSARKTGRVAASDRCHITIWWFGRAVCAQVVLSPHMYGPSVTGGSVEVKTGANLFNRCALPTNHHISMPWLGMIDIQFELEADLIEQLRCWPNMHVQHSCEPCRHFWHRVVKACRSPFQDTLSTYGIVTIPILLPSTGSLPGVSIFDVTTACVSF